MRKVKYRKGGRKGILESGKIRNGEGMFGRGKSQQRPIVAKSSFSSPILYVPLRFVCLIY
jgi:hypothetical protein